MATLTIRNVDETTKTALRMRAARRGVSMEQEVRAILEDVVVKESAAGQSESSGRSLYEAIRDLVEPHGGFEIELPERTPPREPPKFE